jgi:hypothetical protein
MQSWEIFRVLEVPFLYFKIWIQFEVLKNLWDNRKWFNRAGPLA